MCILQILATQLSILYQFYINIAIKCLVCLRKTSYTYCMQYRNFIRKSMRVEHFHWTFRPWKVMVKVTMACDPSNLSLPGIWWWKKIFFGPTSTNGVSRSSFKMPKIGLLWSLIHWVCTKEVYGGWKCSFDLLTLKGQGQRSQNRQLF